MTQEATAARAGLLGAALRASLITEAKQGMRDPTVIPEAGVRLLTRETVQTVRGVRLARIRHRRRLASSARCVLSLAVFRGVGEACFRMTGF
jgi:hypothetical protein